MRLFLIFFCSVCIYCEGLIATAGGLSGDSGRVDARCSHCSSEIYPNNLKHRFLTRKHPEFERNEVGVEAAKRNTCSDAGRLTCSGYPKPSKTDASGIELTDAILPRIPSETVAQCYQMLRDIDRLFKKQAITYWLTAGSLLGAVRHGAMIPWDDDIDLSFFEADIAKVLSLRPEWKALGYELFVSRDYLKVYLVNGQVIQNKEGKAYPWKYPFVDLFPMKQHEDKVVYASERLCHSFEKDWFFYRDVCALEDTAFGPLSVPIPSHAVAYLERAYGADVWEVAYAEYSHASEQKLSKVKVKLVTR